MMDLSLLDNDDLRGDPAPLLQLARQLESEGATELLASALDRAYGWTPADPSLVAWRARVLDTLAVEVQGIRFRYVPAGPFMMGSEQGDPDERPARVMRTEAFWLSETPVSWADYCRAMGWLSPPAGHPQSLTEISKDEQWDIAMGRKVRLQYCEDETLTAYDWHCHDPSLHGHFSAPPRARPERPYTYSDKPMVAVSWKQALAFGKRLSQSDARDIEITLPGEAEWEKGARGGLIGCLYPWGDEPPTSERCDFRRFESLSIRPMSQFAPNGYGLRAVSGTVWEWTADGYDALAYAGGAPHPDELLEKVVRGGSWADCAEAVTVSFRASRRPEISFTPNIGFRLCRRRKS